MIIVEASIYQKFPVMLTPDDIRRTVIKAENLTQMGTAELQSIREAVDLELNTREQEI